MEFARSRGWTLKDGFIYFPKESELAAAAGGEDIEPQQEKEMSQLVIENALGYARELETIV